MIHGYVQGVFYRASTREAALNLGLKGWVKNLPNGKVEAMFEGQEEKVRQAVEWCKTGPPGALVNKIEEEWQDYTGSFKTFDVIQ